MDDLLRVKPVVRIAGVEGVVADDDEKILRWDNPFTRTVGRLIDPA